MNTKVWYLHHRVLYLSPFSTTWSRRSSAASLIISKSLVETMKTDLLAFDGTYVPRQDAATVEPAPA